jgi:hypothetical protein
MTKVKAFYDIAEELRENILNALDENFGLRGSADEDYISLRGREESGIEAVRLSLEDGVIKVIVSLEDDSLLEKFNAVLGEPKRIKGRRRRSK